MAKCILIAIGMVELAHADLVNSWTGFYAGVNAGLAFNNAQLRSQQLGFTDPSEHCNTNSDLSTFFPGLQLGFMHQFPNTFVAGLETNLTVNTNQNNTSSCSSVYNPNVSDRFLLRNQMQSSIKGRVGRALKWNKNDILPFITTGASIANVGLTYSNEGGDYFSKHNTQAGWLIGAGIEWAFKQNWSLRAEYSYIGYGNTIRLKIPSVYGLIDPNGNASVNLSSNNVTVSVNYWI